MQSLFRRITCAFVTVPCAKDWVQAVELIVIFAVLYLPIGFTLGFLKIEIQSSWQTILSVITGTFFMPALLEELGFRVVLLPHPTEFPTSKQWIFSLLSWFGFMAYHLHPFTPLFFREPAFLIGAGLIGIVCTISYLENGSIWVPVTIHWLIVAAWLLLFGGLARFHS
ncbi:CPBP family intramembrane metalloprotease [Leptolyngbya sp. FACHB-321]|uniref:CPBP family glutamic-type intramembrane protease n=1 Tax=Leptolyngbya sp. FACHB-321 TaxID=2692807 RepID=UPI0016857268|nr:CPBP family intramembrane metalloprotease [Leptolyngbya sp. FACHB-321]